MLMAIDMTEATLFERVCFSNADVILSVSRAHKDEISVNYGVPPEKIISVYNGVDTDIFNRNANGSEIRTKYRIDDDAPLVLYAG